MTCWASISANIHARRNGFLEEQGAKAKLDRANLNPPPSLPANIHSWFVFHCIKVADTKSLPNSIHPKDRLNSMPPVHEWAIKIQSDSEVSNAMSNSSPSISFHMTISAACMVGSRWRLERRFSMFVFPLISSPRLGSRIRTRFWGGGVASYISCSSSTTEFRGWNVFALGTKAFRRTNIWGLATGTLLVAEVWAETLGVVI